MSPGSDSDSPQTRGPQPKRPPKRPGQSPKETKKLVLHIYGMSNARIDSAIHEIESLCKHSTKTKLLKTPQVQDFVSRMTQDQVVICY